MSFYDSFGYYLYVGYTFAQKGEIYAIQRDGQKAYEMLKLLWEDFCLQNGFHCNGDYKDKYEMLFKYRPFTLEGNMCAIDLLQEMLLQDHHGDTVIAPAIPDSWKNFSFKLRSKNGVMIESCIENGELIECGSHAELMELGGVYRKIYDMQMSRDNENAGEAACGKGWDDNE